jgi:chorismate-pyruvate lyase
MSEELQIPQVLERLKEYPDLRPIERVLAAHTGTVQLLLSLWWNEPVDVVIVSQTEEDGKIHRVVMLTCRNSHLVAAHAESLIPIEANDREVIADVRAKELGLGQIAVKHEIQVTRVLHEVEVTSHEMLSRFYSMSSRSRMALHYEIRESFPRVHYR